jgi:hypothetical protein
MNNIKEKQPFEGEANIISNPNNEEIIELQQ